VTFISFLIPASHSMEPEEVQFQCKNKKIKNAFLALNNAIDTVESYERVFDGITEEKLYRKVEKYFVDSFFGKEPQIPRYVC